MFRSIVIVIALTTMAVAAPPTTLPVYSLKIPHTTATYELVKLPAGKVRMSPKKWGEAAVVVEVPSIWMGKTEVTWDCYDVWAYALDLPQRERPQARAKPFDGGSRPTPSYGPPDHGFGHEGHPVIGAHFNAIQLYCKWLSNKTGRRIRLPTEREWMYACRAGLDEKAVDPQALKETAWFRDNADGMTAKVAKLAPNDFGLYDMLGNAAELVQPLSDEKWFAKGGSFKDKARYVNSAYRNYYDEDWQAKDPSEPKSTSWLSDGEFVGFRLVMEATPPKP
jgi:formylglycine-generating enzyme required for sulfatase activity